MASVKGSFRCTFRRPPERTGPAVAPSWSTQYIEFVLGRITLVFLVSTGFTTAQVGCADDAQRLCGVFLGRTPICRSVGVPGRGVVPCPPPGRCVVLRDEAPPSSSGAASPSPTNPQTDCSLRTRPSQAGLVTSKIESAHRDVDVSSCGRGFRLQVAGSHDRPVGSDLVGSDLVGSDLVGSAAPRPSSLRKRRSAGRLQLPLARESCIRRAIHPPVDPSYQSIVRLPIRVRFKIERTRASR
ncbi:MAG: hypothetical protein ACI9OJ_005735 [Myxococcota bacterium]|jgi:hypothetical protein